jgi:hypothetical protein
MSSALLLAGGCLFAVAGFGFVLLVCGLIVWVVFYGFGGIE